MYLLLLFYEINGLWMMEWAEMRDGWSVWDKKERHGFRQQVNGIWVVRVWKRDT